MPGMSGCDETCIRKYTIIIHKEIVKEIHKKHAQGNKEIGRVMLTLYAWDVRVCDW